MRRAGIAAILLVAVLVFAGCAQELTAAEQKAKCFSNETLIQTEIRLFKADSGMDAPFQTVLDKTQAVCPSGGTYRYDPATGVVTCSVHGHQ